MTRLCGLAVKSRDGLRNCRQSTSCGYADRKERANREKETGNRKLLHGRNITGRCEVGRASPRPRLVLPQKRISLLPRIRKHRDKGTGRKGVQDIQCGRKCALHVTAPHDARNGTWSNDKGQAIHGQGEKHKNPLRAREGARKETQYDPERIVAALLSDP